MDFRALPPHCPEDTGLRHAGPHTRFGKRRSDRFAIYCQLLQLLVGISFVVTDLPLLRLGLTVRR
jgi:hypothetical protein